MKKISKEIRKYDEWMDIKYAKREDKDNILPVGMTDAEFCEWVRHILLGDDWYAVMPMGNDQINEEALEEIIFRKCGMNAKDRMKNRLNNKKQKEHR